MKVYHTHFSKNSKSHKIANRGASIVMKIVMIKRLWLLHWYTKFHIDISRRLQVIDLLKITFLDVLDYSEYFEANILDFFFTLTAARKQKGKFFLKRIWRSAIFLFFEIKKIPYVVP